MLPAWSYLAVGGQQPEETTAVAAAWRMLHLAGKLLNDAAEQRASRLLPEPPAVIFNAGIALVFLAQQVLAEDDLAPEALATLQAEFARVGLKAVAGQHARLRGMSVRLWRDYQELVAARSGAPFALGARAGAYLMWAQDSGAGELDEGRLAIRSLADYGYHLGLMLQLADDFNGVWRPDGESDLAAGRVTWPLLYGQAMAGRRERELLARLLEHAGEDPTCEAAVRAMLVELDVPLAMAVASEEEWLLAEAALEPLDPSEAREMLVKLAKRVMLAPQGTE